MQVAKRHSQGGEQQRTASSHYSGPSSLLTEGHCDFCLHDGHDPIIYALKPVTLFTFNALDVSRLNSKFEVWPYNAPSP